MSEATHLDAWRRLYAAADLVKKLAPWTWMDETDVFGVQFPETTEIGYVSVMGGLGVHFAVSVYLGDHAVHRFLDIEESPDTEESVMHVLELPQLMVSFEDREELEKEDRELIKQLGLKYRGRNNWPLFRSYRPGFYPWLLEAPEVERLAVALEQFAGVAMRFEDNPELLERDDAFLVRVYHEEGEQSEWIDRYRKLPPPDSVRLNIRVPRSDIQQFQSAESEIPSAEVAFNVTPMRVGQRGERPTVVYMLLVVEPESYYILGMEAISPSEGLDKMREELPAKLIAIFNKSEIRPRELRICSPQLDQLLGPVMRDLGVKLTFTPELDAVPEVLESLRGYMGI